METPLFCKHLNYHPTEKIIHCRSQVTCTRLHYLKSFRSCHQGLYCPAFSDSRGREEVDVGFNLLKILQSIFGVVIYNRWYWVAFLGANMFEVHPGQTVPFIHQWGGTTTNSLGLVIGAIFLWPWKMVSVSVCYLFSQSMDEKIKYGLFVLPPKKTVIWRRYCSTGQSCCSITSKRSNAPERSLNQTKATRVCIRSINQSNRSICVVVCCFCFVCAFSFQGHTLNRFINT